MAKIGNQKMKLLLLPEIIHDHTNDDMHKEVRKIRKILGCTESLAVSAQKSP